MGNRLTDSLLDWQARAASLAINSLIIRLFDYPLRRLKPAADSLPVDRLVSIGHAKAVAAGHAHLGDGVERDWHTRAADALIAAHDVDLPNPEGRGLREPPLEADQLAGVGRHEDRAVDQHHVLAARRHAERREVPGH